jgi:hypothetical protein
MEHGRVDGIGDAEFARPFGFSPLLAERAGHSLQEKSKILDAGIR